MVKAQVIVFEFKCCKWVPLNVDSNWNVGSPIVCVDCAVKCIKGRGNKTILGRLYPTACRNYLSPRTNMYAERFIRDGVVVFPESELRGHAPFTVAIKKLIQENKLRESSNLQFLNDSVQDKKKTHHDCRRWRNIMGDASGIVSKYKDIDALLKKCNYLCAELERHLFPEIYFGRRMEDINSDTSNECTFECNKVNILARFAGLDHPQILHRDDDKFGLVVIHILESDGYTFYYMKGSHELSYQYKNLAESGINVVESDRCEIVAKEGDFICFTANLIHAGGSASKRIHPGEDLTTSTLSDLSYHIDLNHFGLSKGIMRGNGKQLIWRYEPDDEKKGLDFPNLFKHNGDSPLFRDTMCRATRAWVLNKRRNSRST